MARNRKQNAWFFLRIFPLETLKIETNWAEETSYLFLVIEFMKNSTSLGVIDLSKTSLSFQIKKGRKMEEEKWGGNESSFWEKENNNKKAR